MKAGRVPSKNLKLKRGIRVDNEIIHLLQERNRYLIKFSTLNKDELKKFKDGNYNNVDEFYNARESILGMINKIEFLVSTKLEELNNADSVILDGNRTAVEEILKIKDQIVKEILELDLEILSTIDKEKSKIFTEMQAIRKGKRVISNYKSKKSSSKFNEEV